MTHRSILRERSERLEVTMHMLEARNLRLSSEASVLQDSMAVLSSARDVLLQERDGIKAQLEQLKKVWRGGAGTEHGTKGGGSRVRGDQSWAAEEGMEGLR